MQRLRPARGAETVQRPDDGDHTTALLRGSDEARYSQRVHAGRSGEAVTSRVVEDIGHMARLSGSFGRGDGLSI